LKTSLLTVPVIHSSLLLRERDVDHIKNTVFNSSCIGERERERERGRERETNLGEGVVRDTTVLEGGENEP
jgi:hypothetical protein